MGFFFGVLFVFAAVLGASASRLQVYPLSIIVAVFSGAWPQLKCVMMGVCWCTPGRCLSLERRENIMMVLDALVR